MKLAAGLVLLAGTAFGHVMSMSSGDLTIAGTHAHYGLRLPLYEMPHVANPAQSLFAHIVFASGGRPARMVNGACREDSAHGWYLCEADYEFAAPVDSLDVDCTFHQVTVPNHVHLLRAENGGKRDQALFDISFPRATLRFRPPTALETAITQAGGGCMRALGGPAQILFLAALVLAARSRRELAILTATFLTGQMAAATMVSRTAWQPAARFVEAAAALTIAYLAIEILALPKAGMRWLIVGVLGGFHGLYFALFLRTTGYGAGYVLGGAAAAEIVVMVVCALLFSIVSRRLAALKPVQVCASLLLTTGLAWFLMRLRS
ncbi:MAG TPA: HupE/UreJ family protein [Bryobacteraceae bacterium]|nr:HupE/UreJ family protein [Bryobacteraceae bacterium]